MERSIQIAILKQNSLIRPLNKFAKFILGVCFCCGTGCNFIKHGHYNRSYFDSDNKENIIISIQRYLCKKTGRTFSFLPDFLIPYHRYPIKFIIKSLNMVKDFIDYRDGKIVNNQTTCDQILDHLSGYDAFQNLEYSHIKHFIKILDIARERYVLFTTEIIESTFDFLDKCTSFFWNGRKGSLAIKEFIFQKTEYFLFGNASQHRKIYN